MVWTDLISLTQYKNKMARWSLGVNQGQGYTWFSLASRGANIYGLAIAPLYSNAGNTWKVHVSAFSAKVTVRPNTNKK